MRRLALSLTLVLAGLAAGLVVSGRMRATTDAAATRNGPVYNFCHFGERPWYFRG